MTATYEAVLGAAREACGTMMRAFDAPDLPPKKHFHYHQGVFLSGMQNIEAIEANPKYFDYVKAWVDAYVDERGDIRDFNPGQLDDLQPGVLLFDLYARTGDERYQTALDTIAYFYAHFPVTPEGGYWHKAWDRNQMWLDGLYMAGPFCARYGARYGREDLLDSALAQAELMHKNTRDPKTGLWYHAWDYNRRMPWANPVTGQSPEFWGRAMGWAAYALLEEYERFPAEHPRRARLADIACELLAALMPHQDEATGLWHQVVDKGGAAGNWLESSCTCLYTAALCKAVRLKLMADPARQSALKGCEGILDRLTRDERGLVIDNVCIGTGVGDYAHYCARPTSKNDLHGVGAFLLMCAETARMLGANA